MRPAGPRSDCVAKSQAVSPCACRLSGRAQQGRAARCGNFSITISSEGMPIVEDRDTVGATEKVAPGNTEDPDVSRRSVLMGAICALANAALGSLWSLRKRNLPHKLLC